jgi:feruloyl esterase
LVAGAGDVRWIGFAAASSLASLLNAYSTQIYKLKRTMGVIKKALLIGSVASSTLAISMFAAHALAHDLDHAPMPTVPAAPAMRLSCDDTLKAAFRPDANTEVTFVRLFQAGADLHLGEKPSGFIASHAVCLVKLNVGPGHPGPADAPSTSRGIGIELWLPAPADWTGRVRVLGGGGFAGTPEISSLNAISTISGGRSPGKIAADEGSVTAVTDAGHVGRGPAKSNDEGSFAMNPDGSINEAGWTDFASRGVHEMALKAKGLAAAYYGRAASYAYWDGCSTGGRQGLKEAQEYPDDFDGILAGSPAINWTRFITSEMYPQLIMQRDLLGKLIDPAQLDLVSAAAVSDCDRQLNGEHDGFITDQSQCTYDPVRDRQVLCKSDGGLNATDSCVTALQARAINKMWYGQTVDGSAPAPNVSNGYNEDLRKDQLWYGVTRGARLTQGGLAMSRNGVPVSFSIAANQVALILQEPAIADPVLRNATGNGSDGWKALGYADLARVQRLGAELQSRFGGIDTDNADLSAFRARGGKLIHFHGTADPVITIQGSNNYYARVAARMGGYNSVRQFYRYYQIPAMGHCRGLGTVDGLKGVSPPANPPLPATDQLFNALVAWVEKGRAPDELTMRSQDGAISRPLCPYPSKLTYRGGGRSIAASYKCS